jgi:hypothetical protein
MSVWRHQDGARSKLKTSAQLTGQTTRKATESREEMSDVAEKA